MVPEAELAPDGRPLERGIGLGGVAAQALGSVLLDVASFVEEAVIRGQGQREDGGRELVHGCLCLRRRVVIRAVRRRELCVAAPSPSRAAGEARAGAAKARGAPPGLW